MAVLVGVKARRREEGEALTKGLHKGFIAEHRDIELLKLRNFTVSKKFPDAFLTDVDGQAKLAEVIGAMVGFVRRPCPL